MGNAQSSEAPRRTSHKLSKPKTGNHATAGLLSPAVFAKSTRRLPKAPLPNPPPASPAAASTPTMSSAVGVSGALDRRVDSDASFHSTGGSQRESRRRSLFRSRSSRNVADPVRRNSSVGPASRMVDRLSRTSSMTYESAVAYYWPPSLDNGPSQPATRTSCNYNLTSYEAKRLVNLAPDTGSEHATAMSENQMTVATEATWNSSNPADDPGAAITRVSSNVSLHMPVRRRSVIQTPGVATRSSSARDSPAVRKLSFRHSHPATPRVSRQPSFESYRGGVVSMLPSVQDPESYPRVVTPCEEQYQSIGAFKLGSLRITNGSPCPLSPQAETGGVNDGKSVGGAATHDGYSAGIRARETGAMAATGVQRPAQSPKCPPGASLSPLLSPNQPLPRSPALDITSKASALEDNLFDDELQPEYSSGEVLDVRVDPNAKSAHPQVESDAGKTLRRTDSGFVSATSPSSETSDKPLTKADSGYSSSISLRSFQAQAGAAEDQTTASSLEKHLSVSSGQWIPSVIQEKQNPSGRTAPLYPVAPDSEDPPPLPAPPKDYPQSPPKSPNPKASRRKPLHVQSSADQTGAMPSRTTKPAVIPFSSLPPSDKGPLFLESLSSIRGSVRSSRSDNSSPAISAGSGRQRPARLQRLLTRARRPVASLPIVHTAQAPEQSSIPPVPRDDDCKLHEHAGAFSTAARKLALRPRASLDTLQTIFSVGSLETGLKAVNPVQTGPTASEPEPREGEMSPRYVAPSIGLALLATNIPSPTLPSPVAQAVAVESKTRTSLAANLSRKTSRESIQNYPAAQSLDGRRASVESFHSCASGPPTMAEDPGPAWSPTGILMDPRRLPSFRQPQSPQSPPYKSPNREVQADDCISCRPSQTVEAGSSRHNSISSVQSDGGYAMQRLGSTERWQARAVPQPLRHRASFDSYSYQQRFPHYGYPPSMSTGYTAPLDPLHDLQSIGQPDAAATWSRSQAGVATAQWYQGDCCQPYVPRDRYRHSSTGNRTGYGPNPPYRILHSYNSPAYRNVPIWG